MPILPRSINDMLNFAEVHADVFDEAFAQIGLSHEEAVRFKEAASQAKADHTAQMAAENVKLAATLAAHMSMTRLRAVASETLATIKAFAETQEEPLAVYAAAEIPRPSAGGPLAAPGKPFKFRTALLSDGEVTLAWACVHPKGSSGTMYEVRRRVGAAGGAPQNGRFELLGTVGTKTFTDSTIPAGATSVVYEVTAVRSTVRGEAAQFNVNFGRQQMPVVQTVGVKMAA